VSGFITMHRDALDHPLLQDGERFRAWFWLVAKACWKPTRFNAGGHVVTLERGQLCYSVRELAESWKWTKSTVDRFIQRLIDADMLISTRAKTGTGSGTSSGTSRSIITICNYAKYQDAEALDGTDGGKQNGTAAGQQRDIKEQGNKGTIEIDPKGSCRSGDRPKPVLVVNEDHPLTVSELVDEWNGLADECGLPRIAKLTDSRRKRASARLRQYPEIAAWKRAFACIRGSPWMHGANEKGWRADFDFLLQDKSFTKLVEGSYGQA
jgi:hypothetical protein